ncbi:MAG: osmoprotectant NAGGN system M42 family peptidase [Alphaproteobacteria bacterium]|jgi:peptidase M42 family hydrolase|nr:osmoprotectant NAGGN system M42 family peptidase [Alphaproteobacteria bacterium]
MIIPRIDTEYLLETLETLVRMPSPTGFTDRVVLFTCRELDRLGISYELTRRGAIRANLPGRQKSPDRAMVVHLDTLGAMVRELKPNGRLSLAPIGTWSSRFAEGGRITLFTDDLTFRGTVLPIKASGHTYDEEVDTQPVSWDHVELRIDAPARSEADLRRLGVNIGDYVAFDPGFEFDHAFGFINSRHLDNKAGVAALLAAAKTMVDDAIPLPIDCHLLFTISEEVGSGASAILHGDVAEMVTIDNGTVAPGQNSKETGVTIAMRDSVGPFDYHLTYRLLNLAREFNVPHQRDAFRHYRCDSASALEAGNDIRTALICFGIDASHGYERVHLDALRCLAQLSVLYMQTELTVARDTARLGPVEGFPEGQGAYDPGPVEV